MKGSVSLIVHFPAYISHITYLSMATSNTLYAIVKGDATGCGIFQIKLGTLESSMIVHNESDVCMEASCLTAVHDGILFYDIGTHQMKHWNTERITVIAGSGLEGVKDGNGQGASFHQVSGMCVEYDSIFIRPRQLN